MKEVTMITTCEITVIETVNDEDVALLEANKNSVEKQIRNIIKSDLGADDVVIMKTKLFIRD